MYDNYLETSNNLLAQNYRQAHRQIDHFSFLEASLEQPYLIHPQEALR